MHSILGLIQISWLGRFTERGLIFVGVNSPVPLKTEVIVRSFRGLKGMTDFENDRSDYFLILKGCDVGQGFL